MLADLLTGAREETDPEAARMLAANPALREEYSALAAMASQLDATGEEQREDLTDLRERPPDDADVAEARAFLESHAGADRRRAPAWPLIAAAAAIVIVAVWITTGSFGGGGVVDPPTVLGEHVESMLPTGSVRSLEQFEWQPKQPLERGGWYEVQVFDRRDGTPIAQSSDILTTSWKPTPEELSDILARRSIRWVLTCFDADGGTIWSEEAEFSLR